MDQVKPGDVIDVGPEADPEDVELHLFAKTGATVRRRDPSPLIDPFYVDSLIGVLRDIEADLRALVEAKR